MNFVRTIVVVISGFILQNCGASSQEVGVTDIVFKRGEDFIQDPRINAVSIAIYSSGEDYVKHFGELDAGLNNRPTDSA